MFPAFASVESPEGAQQLVAKRRVEILIANPAQRADCDAKLFDVVSTTVAQLQMGVIGT
jgi:hypothetical protein